MKDKSIARIYDKSKLLRIAMNKGLTKEQALEWRAKFLADEKERIPDFQKELERIFTKSAETYLSSDAEELSDECKNELKK